MSAAHAGTAASHRSASARDAGRLRAALLVTGSVLVLELVGGIWSGSIALLADAGHMLTDAGSLTLAWLAARLSTRPRSARHSYGYGRTEVLAALANGLLLGGASVAIAIESVARIRDPQPIAVGPMLGVAVVGLLANLVSAQLLTHGGHERSLNVRAAFWHVVGDALGSAVVIAAGIAIAFWDWTWADGVGGIAIGGLLVAHAFRLVRESVDILLEGAPRHLDLATIAAESRELPGVRSIHDLHIWSVTSGFTAMSAHVELEPGADPERVRRAVHRLLHERYDVEHTTIQTEAAPGLLEIAAEPPDRAAAPEGCGGGEHPTDEPL